jgi:hypothetical protein
MPATQSDKQIVKEKLKAERRRQQQAVTTSMVRMVYKKPPSAHTDMALYFEDELI